jgi:hypothetical protein
MAGGIVGLCIAAYLVALAINWRDREPSPTALRFASLYRDRPAAADEDNAYIYVMGFTVAPDESPYQMGLRRIAWLRESTSLQPLDISRDPLGKRPDYRVGRLAAIREFIDACKPASVSCDTAFGTGDGVFEQWMASESWLLVRYRELIPRRGWRETVPTDLSAPFPSYQLVMDGQKLLLLNAKILARRGEYASVRQLLEEDLRFWRGVLESSDTLVSRMIATAAITRHFELGNLIFREIPPGDVMAAVPAEWNVALSESELSMRRCLVGEWTFMSAALRNMMTYRSAPNDESFASGVLGRLTAPFYQQQDTINAHAEYLSEMAERMSVPLDEYEEALSRATEFSARTRSEAVPPRSVYNIIGRIATGVGAYDYGSYARRVGDLEGVRRVALAAVTLRAAKVAAAEVPAQLAVTSLRNPYDDRPFEWDPKSSAIIFRGLEPSERGVHRIRYE